MLSVCNTFNVTFIFISSKYNKKYFYMQMAEAKKNLSEKKFVYFVSLQTLFTLISFTTQ